MESDTGVADVTRCLDGENIPHKSVEWLSNRTAKFKQVQLTVGASKFQQLFIEHCIRVRAFKDPINVDGNIPNTYCIIVMALSLCICNMMSTALVKLNTIIFRVC